jgi:hypothetical protein
MKLQPFKLAAALALATLAFQSQAECVYPKAPTSIPDGKSASEPEMIAAMKNFKAYNDEVASFGKCLDEEAGGGNQSMAVKTMKAKKIAAAQEELQSKAKAFNEQVRVFKARA